VLDIPVRLSVELGRTEMPIREVVNLGRGSVVELDGSPGAPLDVRVNGVLVGRGEVVVVNEERLGLRFVEVVNQTERIKRLK
jgi:flagellar motor switch protein FliN/FliY